MRRFLKERKDMEQALEQAVCLIVGVENDDDDLKCRTFWKASR
jgi:hypothetical protein